MIGKILEIIIVDTMGVLTLMTFTENQHFIFFLKGTVCVTIHEARTL